MSNPSNDFAALARQYWNLWGDTLREFTPQQPAVGAGQFGMGGMFDDWTRQMGGQPEFGNVMSHFNRQSRDWFAQMQQVAAQFVGRDHQAKDVAQAWKDAFGGSHPFDGLLQGMRGSGLENFMQWADAGSPSLQGLRAEVAAALRMPAFGFTREHQERLQALGLAQLRMQEAFDAYSKLLAEISKNAFDRFELKLAEREEPGRQITSVRALFDLWVDAAEDAWAEKALSTDYRHVFAGLVNAQMHLRAAIQAIKEQGANLSGAASRTELDSAHRKIAELERQLRRLQRGGIVQASPPQTSPPVRPKPAKKVAVKRASVKAASAGKSAAKTAKAATAKSPASKSVLKRTAKSAVKPTKPAVRKR